MQQPPHDPTPDALNAAPMLPRAHQAGPAVRGPAHPPTTPPTSPPTSPHAGIGVPGLVPPTQPTMWFAPPLPRWPVAIGVISVVFAGMGLVGWVVGIASWLAFRNVPMPGPGGGMQPNPAMQMFSGPYWWLDVVQSLIGGVCTFLLLWAGIATLRRRPGGRPLHLWFAGLFLVYLLGFNALSLMGLNPAMQRMNAQGAGGMGPAMAQQFMVTGIIVNTVALGAYPVFLLLWFAAPSRSPDQGVVHPPG